MISETFKISQVTIVKTFRKIYDYRKILISDDATEKVIKLSNKNLIEEDTSEQLTVIEEKDYESDSDDEESDEEEIKNLFISNI